MLSVKADDRTETNVLVAPKSTNMARFSNVVDDQDDYLKQSRKYTVPESSKIGYPLRKRFPI